MKHFITLLSVLLLFSAHSSVAQEGKINTDGLSREGEFVPSFGKDPLILLYAPKDIIPYLDNIEKYERDGFEVESLSPEEKATLDLEGLKDPEAPPAPPIIFPHYYVASIMYDTPKAWSVYVNNILITSSNNARDKELYVQSINRDSVHLVWTPQDERVIEQIRKDKENDDIPLLPNLMEHRAVATSSKNPIYILDDSISFTLEPNQFFASGYMKLLEGNPRALNIVTYYPDGVPTSDGVAAAPVPAAEPSAAEPTDTVAAPFPEQYDTQIRKRKSIGERITE